MKKIWEYVKDWLISYIEAWFCPGCLDIRVYITIVILIGWLTYAFNAEEIGSILDSILH